MATSRTITGVNDGSNPFDDQSSGVTTNSNAVNTNVNAHLEDDLLANQIIVNQNNVAVTLGGVIDSSSNYFLDGIIDIGNITIEVPSTGLTMTGYSFDLSGIITTKNDGVIFSSPVGGSGNLLLADLFLEASGTNGKVYDLTDSNGFNAIELNKVNFINCTSLGTWNNYRQGLEVGTGRFGGTPTLELAGTMIGGMRISTSITRGLDSEMTGSLFKAGTGLDIRGRFITDMNCDLPSGTSLLDFSSSNIFNNESLILKGAYFARSGIINPQDTAITPNIDASDVKCLWSDNTGIANTHKYVKSLISTEVLTLISTSLVYVDLNGTWEEQSASHITQIANNRWKILSGNGSYQITGDVTIEGNPGTQASVKVSKSIDSGATWSEINHVKRPINSLAGVRDVGFFTINFISNLAENDLIKLEIENYTDTTDFTAEAGSFLIISQI